MTVVYFPHAQNLNVWEDIDYDQKQTAFSL